MLKPIKIILCAIITIAIAIGAYSMFHGRGERQHYEMSDARVKSITDMVRLCSMTFDMETGIKDTINGKGIYARERLRGTIGFDLDRLSIEQRGDTTYITMPPARMDLHESTAPGAYEVLDSWDARNPIFSRTLTTAEENLLKSRWQHRVIDKLYGKGYVDHARRNAAATLASMLRTLPGEYVIISPRYPRP
ncbi:MAG: hypothetical protein NC117_00695 [Pseudoflavonifractor sp.]|nr:hypothetical protein [Pseudoflavonifractor sp.]